MSESTCGATRDLASGLSDVFRGLIVHRCRKPEGHKGQHYSPQLEGREDGGPCYWDGDDREPTA